MLTPAVHSDHSHPTAWGWAHLGVTLPKALSDHTANYNKDDGLVYITGGCGKCFISALTTNLNLSSRIFRVSLWFCLS